MGIVSVEAVYETVNKPLSDERVVEVSRSDGASSMRVIITPITIANTSTSPPRIAPIHNRGRANFDLGCDWFMCFSFSGHSLTIHLWVGLRKNSLLVFGEGKRLPEGLRMVNNEFSAEPENSFSIISLDFFAEHYTFNVDAQHT